MIFCGQCGLQLAPGSTRCPRCGATVEETGAGGTGGELHTDDATVATPSLLAQNQLPSQPQSGGQQPLILRPGASAPGNNNTYGTQTPYDATSMMDATSQTQSPPRGNSYPGYPPQSGPAYPSQSGPNYAPVPQSGSNYGTQNVYPPEYTTHGASSYGSGMSYPQQPMGYPQATNQYQLQQDEHAMRAARGRTTGLILVLCGLIFILTAVVLFALQSGLFGGNKALIPGEAEHLFALGMLHTTSVIVH
ncbi:zinc ribbon domain-containing protein [Dictyobacter aurantiacus]|uniref:Zinc-ribbon domain-containing protein n=1 Tax=Dictyobacter aurantiacus TaxID=1936993 RepID=A0A401Z942_9CHLR|nr:zinc ribbon domain-containing protein [Dictyobacter aurantiacus]GCE03316.1 hypothetical protein KDAU_06450 [Dictyobacter aurantiacus]